MRVCILLFTLGLLCEAAVSYLYGPKEGVVRRSSPAALVLPETIAEPMVINTWAFTNATKQAHTVLAAGGSAVDAVVSGCSVCEEQQCDGTVGWGGSPDEQGETTLDAMIMDGSIHDVGAVGALRGVKSAISVARHVLDYTQHSLLVGSQATEFAIQMGFKFENLTSEESDDMYNSWLSENCQPNYWKNVVPSHETSCGPYQPATTELKNHESGLEMSIQSKKHSPPSSKSLHSSDRSDHDTIGMVAVDINGKFSCGTTSNGRNHKIPGRVGDSPIPGSGCYADSNIGGAAATGDGDIMMRFMPALLAVKDMEYGALPETAAAAAILKIVRHYPDFEGGIIAANAQGGHGAACHGFPSFEYSIVNNKESDDVMVHEVICTYSNKDQQ